ncbi:MAG: GNAT family N-acetyltransferase [Clostridia bacterium]|nr:GNAT family N-acetyltransferase [Clostridia bacterium]
MDYETKKTELDLSNLSSQYTARKLTESDIEDVYHLARSNVRYYRLLNEKPTRRSLTTVVTKPDSEDHNAHFVGFYDETKLVAFMDMISDYPDKNNCFLGWFMVDAELQNNGVGSELFADIRASLKAQGVNRLSLGCVKENTDAIRFWEEQGFTLTSEEKQVGKHIEVIMTRDI